MSSEIPTEDERLEFLRHAITLAEWNIRTLDTKAQISIVAFVVSLNPLWSILTTTCPRAASSLIVAMLLVLFCATVLLFALVLLPGTSAQPKPTGGWSRKALFTAGDPNAIAASLYADRIRSLASEGELAAETLALAHIREIKSRRFQHALRSIFVFYAWFVATFLMLRNCGA